MTRDVNQFFFGNDVISFQSRLLDFRLQPATADAFPVVFKHAY